MSGTNHSWSITAQNLCRALVELGHRVSIITSNDDICLPEDLKPLLKTHSGPVPSHIDFTYTMPPNFKQRLRGHCNLGIYNYESSDLPEHYREGIHYCDYLLPSSTFCYNIFLNAGVPKEKLRIVPHGVDTNQFNQYVPKLTKLRTKKAFKFVCVAIPHARKNLEGLIEAYATAFTKQDNVCLVLKTRVLKVVGQRHDVNIVEIISRVKSNVGADRFPSIEVVDGSIDNMASLYNACDCFVSTTHSEGFGLPFLEAMACGIPVIAPNFSGQQDFLNDNNSLLINTGHMYAPATAQYWNYSVKALTGHPDIKHCAKLMKEIFEHKPVIMMKLKGGMDSTVQQYSWKKAAQMMVDLYYEKQMKKAK